MNLPSPTPDVVIALPTQNLRNITSLLDRLSEQQHSVQQTVVVVVLHNAPLEDPYLKARVGAFGFTYQLVPALGFSNVRNAAILLAKEAQILIFIDDDELPGSGWLSNHLHSMESWRADVIFGPVHTIVPPDAPAWLDGGRLLRPRERFPDGPTNRAAYSGNTSIRLAFIRRHQITFDQRYNKTGGEDYDFFTRCRQLGANIAWSEKALVTEMADPDRIRIIYSIKRNLTQSRFNTRYQISELGRGRMRIGLRKSGRLVLGSIELLIGMATLDSKKCAQGVCSIALAMGGISGVLTRDRL